MTTPPAATLRLLIVEDEAIVAANIWDRLGKLGYKIDAIADTGEEAIALATGSSPTWSSWTSCSKAP